MKFSFKKYYRDLSIRNKMFLTWSLIVIATVLLVGLGVYSQVRRAIEENVESALSNATATILKMVETTAQTSIKNYLRAVAEKNLQLVSFYYDSAQKGLMTEEEAKKAMRDLLFHQTIGETGYIYCLDSSGNAVVHPNPAVEGKLFSNFKFVRDQMVRKHGYLEYMWQNPGDEQPRPKALFMLYFPPWDWIISVTSYRSEFNRLINISDFKDSILSQTFGKTGYSYVLASNGDVVIHPYLSGNAWDARDDQGNYLVRTQCRNKSGKLLYAWRNPGEKTFRDKLVIYNYIEEYDWIVASTGYIEEFYAPVKSMRNIMAATIGVIIMLVLPATFFIAGGITRPLKELETKLSQGSLGNLSGRMHIRSKDEIGNLAAYFNQFMDKLEHSSRKIQTEIKERRRTEELFSKAFHASPSGLFIVNLSSRRFINANQSFVDFIGSDRDRIINCFVKDLPLFRPSVISRIIRQLKKEGHIRNMDVEFVNAAGQKRLGILNAEQVHIWGEPCLLCAVEDLTETKRLEREIIDISEREQLQLGQYLHDDLSSHLMGIEVMQTVLRRKLEKEGSGHLAAVDRMRKLVRDAIDKTDRISRGLCPTHIAEKELELTLKELCRDIEQVYQVACRFDHGEDAVALSPGTAVHIYYIAREAAHNAVKHGNAKNIWLSLSVDGEAARLEIRDNGCGLPETVTGKGMGIRIMHYRARRIGGELDICRSPEGGARLVLTFNPAYGKETISHGITIT